MIIKISKNLYGRYYRRENSTINYQTNQQYKSQNKLNVADIQDAKNELIDNYNDGNDLVPDPPEEIPT